MHNVKKTAITAVNACMDNFGIVLYVNAKCWVNVCLINLAFTASMKVKQKATESNKRDWRYVLLLK